MSYCSSGVSAGNKDIQIVSEKKVHRNWFTVATIIGSVFLATAAAVAILAVLQSQNLISLPSNFQWVHATATAGSLGVVAVALLALGIHKLKTTTEAVAESVPFHEVHKAPKFFNYSEMPDKDLEADDNPGFFLDSRQPGLRAQFDWSIHKWNGELDSDKMTILRGIRWTQRSVDSESKKFETYHFVMRAGSKDGDPQIHITHGLTKEKAFEHFHSLTGEHMSIFAFDEELTFEDCLGHFRPIPKDNSQPKPFTSEEYATMHQRIDASEVMKAKVVKNLQKGSEPQTFYIALMDAEDREIAKTKNLTENAIDRLNKVLKAKGFTVTKTVLSVVEQPSPQND